jgi:hypothetical protein
LSTVGRAGPRCLAGRMARSTNFIVPGFSVMNSTWVSRREGGGPGACRTCPFSSIANGLGAIARGRQRRRANPDCAALQLAISAAAEERAMPPA